MRTTATLDPDTASIVRREMERRGISFKQALNDATRAGASAERAPFSTTVRHSGTPTVNLDRALGRVGAGWNLLNDAHLAAVAIEYRASVVSSDADFGRFDEVRWLRPDQLTPRD